MIFFSTVLACLLIGSGLGAVVIGSGMIVLERGWSMVISGTIVATGGALLLGIAMLLRELRRLPERLADRLADALPEIAASLPPALDSGSVDAFHAAHDRPAPVRPRLEPPLTTEQEESRPDLARSDLAGSGDLAPDSPAGNGALKIQISLHNDESPTGDDTDESDRTRRKFWPRFGKPDVPARVEKTQPEAVPAGPTAAELARERLALADVPDRPAPSGGEAPVSTPDKNETATETGIRADPASAAARLRPEVPPPAPKGDTAAGSGEGNGGDGRRDDGKDGARKDNGTPPAVGDSPAAAQTQPASGDSPEGSADTVVGSYRAGANVYTMFDSGAIEAETPKGVFRFASLDKLKAYIASGEDAALAGTPVDRKPETSAAG